MHTENTATTAVIAFIIFAFVGKLLPKREKSGSQKKKPFAAPGAKRFPSIVIEL